MSFFLSSVYENTPVLQTCKAKLQHLQRVKQCLLLLKPHAIEIFRIKKSGELIFLYQKRLFANLKAFRRLETLEKKEPDLIFLLTADLQYIFLTIIEKEFIILHRGEVFDAPKYEFISLLNQIDLQMDSVKGFLGILLINRNFRELKILEYEFEAAKNLLVSTLKNLDIENNERLINLIDMTPEKNSFVLGGLYEHRSDGFVFNECIFWYDSDKLNVRNTLLTFNDPCNGIFYQPFAKEIYLFFSEKVRVWHKKNLNAEFKLKIDFGTFIDLVDSALISDKRTGGIYLFTPKQKNVNFLGFVNLCSSFELLNKNRIFAGSKNDNSLIFEILNEKELVIHESNYKPGYIKQLIPIERDGAKSLLINSAAKREPLNILQRGLGIKEEMVLSFNENALGMHVLRNNGLVILVFPGKNLLLSVNNEKIAICKAKSEAFHEVLNSEILKISELEDIFAVITRNQGTFIFNSDQELICHHKCQGDVFFSSEYEHFLFLVCFLSDGNYCFFALNMKKPTEFTKFSLNSPKQISSFCPLSFDSFIISYWFDLELKIVRTTGIIDESPIITIPNLNEYSSSISVSSMVMANKNHLCIGLNNGRLLIYKITQNEQILKSQEIKNIDLGDQPVYFRAQSNKTIFVLSDKVLMVKFGTEFVQKLPLPVLMSEIVAIDMFFGEKAIFLKSNKIILGSFKSLDGGFTVTPCPIGDFEGGAIVAPGENNFIVANLGVNPCIKNVSNNGQEINYTFNGFEPDWKIKSIAFDSKNQVVLVLKESIEESKVLAFFLKKNKFSLFQEIENKKQINFVKFFTEGKFILGSENSISIRKFSKENKKIQTELEKKVLLQIYKIETCENFIICFDVFSKVEIYQYDEGKNNLSHKRTLIADFIIDGGFLSEKMSFFFEKQQKFCCFTKNELKTKKMGIAKHFKLHENVNFCLPLEKNGSTLDKLKANSVVWATEYGNLEILVNLEGEIFAILKKIEQKIKESLGLNQIFSYEKWRKLNELENDENIQVVDGDLITFAKETNPKGFQELLDLPELGMYKGEINEFLETLDLLPFE